MRRSPGYLPCLFLWIAVFAAFALSGCGDWCFAGDVNGSGSRSTGTTHESPCWNNPANGIVKTAAVKSPVCNNCNSPSDVQHVYVTLRGMQLHANTMHVPSDADWIELAPQLASLPLQIDLIGSAPPLILEENAPIPAGYYGEIRLQFLGEPSANVQGLPDENACGNTGWNCLVRADGSVEALRWSGEAPELLILLESEHSNSMAVLPDARTDLQLKVELRPEFLFSSSEGWRVQNALAGRATFAEPQSLVVE